MWWQKYIKKSQQRSLCAEIIMTQWLQIIHRLSGAASCTKHGIKSQQSSLKLTIGRGRSHWSRGFVILLVFERSQSKLRRKLSHSSCLILGGLVIFLFYFVGFILTCRVLPVFVCFLVYLESVLVLVSFPFSWPLWNKVNVHTSKTLDSHQQLHPKQARQVGGENMYELPLTRHQSVVLKRNTSPGSRLLLLHQTKLTLRLWLD